MSKKETRSFWFSDGLWVPAAIIFFGFAFSVVFAFKTLKGYQQPRPLLIKPSSVEKPEEIKLALQKALYPLLKSGYGISTLPKDGEVETKLLSQELNRKSTSDKLLKLSIKRVKLNDQHDNKSVDCKNTALFNLKRKPDRKWKNKFYFTVCTEAENSFALYYAIK